MKPVVANHVVTSNVDDYPKSCRPYAQVLKGRSLLVKKAAPLPIECVARGYISGSGWSSYKASGEVCGIKLPAGLKESDRLPEPIFTPATKEEVGIHDINIDFEETRKRIGRELAERVRDLTLSDLPEGCGLGRDQGHHHRRHQVRIRPRGRRVDPDRRTADPGLIAVLAESLLHTRRRPAEL